MKRIAAVVALIVLATAVYVGDQAIRTLRTLDAVERERDTWQRPDDILSGLELKPGSVVVDLGSGAGYFALKTAPRVTPGGRVYAVDLRRLSLAFLWIRAWRAGFSGLHVIRGESSDPKLPAVPVDAALIVNTYHELTSPGPILDKLSAAMRSGATLVVVDRSPRDGESRDLASGGHHDVPPDDAERQITRHGFRVELKDLCFIEQSPDEHVWWLLVFRRR